MLRYARLHAADFRAPLIEAGFKFCQHFHGDHTGKGENQDADKNFIGLKRRARHGDHEANASGGGIELTDHNADQRTPDTQPEAGQYKRYGRGKNHAFKDLPFACAEASGGREKVIWSGFDTIASIDQDRKHGAEKDNANF